MVANGEVHRLVEPLVFAVHVRIFTVGDLALVTGNELAGDGPTPVYALVTNTNAPDVQIGVGHHGSEVFVRGRVLAEEIPCRYPIAVVEVASDTRFIKPARF